MRPSTSTQAASGFFARLTYHAGWLAEPPAEATISQESVGAAWVGRYGVDAIRVVRIADDGSMQVLTPSVLDEAADPLVFRVLSPRGLSTFALAAVKNAPAIQDKTPAPAPEGPGATQGDDGSPGELLAPAALDARTQSAPYALIVVAIGAIVLAITSGAILSAKMRRRLGAVPGAKTSGT